MPKKARKRSHPSALAVPTLQLNLRGSAKMRKLANRYADNALSGVALGCALPDDWHEMLETLARMSGYWN